MKLITDWLASRRNYIVGAVLYRKFGTDPKLKELFSSPETPHTAARLATELEALLAKPKVVLQAPAPAAEAGEMPASQDPVLQALRNEWQPLYQQMNYLRHQLDHTRAPGAEQDLSLEAPAIDNSPEAIALRLPMVFQILELEQACMRVWERRDHYLQHGRLPEAPAAPAPVATEIPQDPLEAGRFLETLKRNARRNRQLARQNPDNADYALRARDYQQQLEAVLQQIKAKKSNTP